MKFRALVKQLLIAMAMAIPATSFAGNLYVGADFARMKSALALPWGAELQYETNHLRLKGGYEWLDWLALEGQILTKGKDEHAATPTLGASQYDTGLITGLFLKPHYSFRNFGLYVLAGFASTTSTVDCNPSCPPETEARLDGPSYGTGAHVGIGDRLRLSIDYMVYFDDDVVYSDPARGSVSLSQKNTAFGIGINYALK